MPSHRKIVHVPVVYVIATPVTVLHRMVGVLMFVTFAQMQPKTNSHQCCGNA